jgi:hypothetical protein
MYNPQIRSLDYLEDSNQLLVGTRGCEIYEFNGDKSTCLMKGHFDGEVWGASPHPSKSIFAT